MAKKFSAFAQWDLTGSTGGATGDVSGFMVNVEPVDAATSMSPAANIFAGTAAPCTGASTIA